MHIVHHHFQTIGSTNTWAKQHAHEFQEDALTIVTADEQTSGRGRFKRVWQSPPSVNIYVTYCFAVDLRRSDIGHLPQLLALVTSQVLEAMNFEPTLKWPNDVLLKGKKVAGILCETTTELEKRFIILGMGLNVNMAKEELDKIDRPATSLAVETQLNYDVKELLEFINVSFTRALERFLTVGFTPYFEEYAKRSCYKSEQRVSFHDNQCVVEGHFHSLNPDGSVTLRLDEDKLKIYYAGEFL